jgi:hypothetical protein
MIMARAVEGSAGIISTAGTLVKSCLSVSSSSLLVYRPVILLFFASLDEVVGYDTTAVKYEIL